ncbi:MAG: aminoglycoside adenylyltransferase domain-containing protein [Dehalococcoidia bacterium]
MDLLAVLADDADDRTFAKLQRLHTSLERDHPAWRDRIEVQYVSREALRTFREGTSRIAAISPGDPLGWKHAGADWTQNWYGVQENGLAILGPVPSSFIPAIAREEFVRAVVDYMEEVARRAQSPLRHRGAEAYDALTACRALYTALTGEQASKEEAASWAAKRLPLSAGTIEVAVRYRQEYAESHLPCDAETAAELRAFVQAAGRDVMGAAQRGAPTG